MTPQEASLLIAAPKIAVSWTGFKPRSNHVGHILGSAQLTDSNGVYFPGLVLELEVRVPSVTAQCYYLFTIMQRKPQTIPFRAYQLEVVPKAKLSHRGIVDIYGPHEHLGDEAEPDAVSEQSVNCASWSACFDWFKRRTNIQMNTVAAPC